METVGDETPATLLWAGVFRVSGDQSWVSLDTYAPMRRRRALVVVAEPVSPPKGNQSVPIWWANLKTKTNPARGFLLEGSLQNLTKVQKEMVHVDAALDYVGFEVSAFYQSKTLILAGVSACYLGTHYHLENTTLSFGSNVQI